MSRFNLRTFTYPIKLPSALRSYFFEIESSFVFVVTETFLDIEQIEWRASPRKPKV